MSQHDHSDTTPTTAQGGLNIRKDARDLVRLVQCSQCSLPFSWPVTLPCGNSICRRCLPQSHIREHISYPGLASRRTAITCPFAQCGEDHPLDDCNVNVVLTKFMEELEEIVKEQLTAPQEAHTPLRMDEVLPDTVQPANGRPAEDTEGEKFDMVADDEPSPPSSMTVDEGPMLATYAFAQSGKLRYTSEVRYTPSLTDEELTEADIVISNKLREASKRQFECHICYGMMLVPTSTPCGHTWCRKCLARVLDHSRLCATCRRELFLPSSLSRHPPNKSLVDLMDAMLPDMVKARAEAEAEEENSNAEGLATALFVCTTAFPSMPTFLHIFEPRYRLMIRRALETNRQFGMLTYNERMQPQGDLGMTDFLQYGTMLEVQRYQVLPDGRSFIECRGLWRFKVLQYGSLDGYTVGRVERLDDVSLADEEAMEARETSREPAEENDTQGQLDRMSTEELLQVGLGFVNRARQQSAQWLQGQVVAAYGEAPEDPATFPYWFASVLPLLDTEKYTLLPTKSIRERLKITARWVRNIEAQSWWVRRRSAVFQRR